MENLEFDLITFDCYGTLIDWEGGIIAAFQQEAATSSSPIDPLRLISEYMRQELEVEKEYKPYRQVLDDTAGRVARNIGLQIPDERAHFLSESLPRWTPFEDTNRALERLSKRAALGILSNVDDDLLAETRKLFTVDFELIVTDKQGRSYKPGHAHFLEARKRSGGKRQLHAAQSYLHDVVPARALAIPVAWVNRKRESPAPGGPHPDFEVPNMAGLADLFAP